MMLYLLAILEHVWTISSKAERMQVVSMALEHEKESLRTEDEFMAQHLRKEGYKVIGPPKR